MKKNLLFLVLLAVVAFMLVFFCGCGSKSKYEQTVDKREDVYRVDDSLKRIVDSIQNISSR